MVDFDRDETEKLIRSSIREITNGYGDDYWREVFLEKRFPEEFWNDLAEGGWLGTMIPEEYGGQGLGLQEMVAVVEEVAMAGGWPATTFLLRDPVMGAGTIVEHGSDEQKARWLPGFVEGETNWATSITEPEAGLNTTNIDTFAEKDGEEYVIDGRKIWASGIEQADRFTLLARTKPKSEVDSPSHGLTMFVIDPSAEDVEYKPIETDVFSPQETHNLYLDGVRVHESQVIGEPHEGLRHIFDTLNSERVILAIDTVATGAYALEKASEYAREREVFDSPIGSHQAIQHPLADAHADLECAKLVIRKAAWLYDNNRPAGTASNIANLKGGEAAWNACEAAMTTYGGMSASAELGISKIWGYVRHMRIAPVSEQMIRNYLAERALDLPRSY